MRRALLIIGALVVLVVAGAGAYLYLSDEDPPEKRGSSKVEFDEDAGPTPRPAPRREIAVPWPIFGYDVQRTKSAPYKHRPPYRRTWRIDAGDTIEFPPSVGYGNVYIAQQKGKFFALNGKTGRPVFKTKD